MIKIKAAYRLKKEPPPQRRQLEELRKAKKTADPKNKADIQLKIDRLKTSEDQDKKNKLVNKMNKEGVS